MQDLQSGAKTLPLSLTATWGVFPPHSVYYVRVYSPDRRAVIHLRYNRVHGHVHFEHYKEKADNIKKKSFQTRP